MCIILTVVWSEIGYDFCVIVLRCSFLSYVTMVYNIFAYMYHFELKECKIAYCMVSCSKFHSFTLHCFISPQVVRRLIELSCLEQLLLLTTVSILVIHYLSFLHTGPFWIEEIEVAHELCQSCTSGLEWRRSHFGALVIFTCRYIKLPHIIVPCTHCRHYMVSL